VGKNDIYYLGGAAVLLYAYTQGWLNSVNITQVFQKTPKVKKRPPRPQMISSFATVGEWGGATAQPLVDTIIRNRPALIIGLGGYNDTEGKFKPVIDKIDTANIPSIWAKGSDSDDYLSLFGQEGWEYKYEPQGVTFCVLNSVNTATLENMLKTSTSRFKIVIINAPIFSPSSKYGQDVTAQTNLVPLLTKYKVNMVLSAKNKLYYRFVPKGGPNTTVGTTYVGVGTASDIFDPAGSPNGAIKIIENTPGYLRVDVGGTLSCKFLSATGALLDQFTVNEWK
jgi:hypothetical protein